MSRRGSLGFLIFLVIIALLTWMEVPSWHNGEGAVAVLPPAAPASEAAAPAAPASATQTMAAAPASEATAPAAAPGSAAASAAATPGSAAAPAPQSEVAMATPETPKAQAEAPEMPEPGAGPTFDIVRVEPTGEGVMAGQAEPKATVEVLDGNAPIARTQSDDTGAWALSLDKPLEPGSHDLGLRATSADKGTATLSDERVTVSVPEKGSKDVLVLLNAPNAPSKVLEVPGGAATVPDKSATAAAGTAPATAAAPDTGTAVASAEAPAAPGVQPQTAIVAEAPVTTEAPVKTEAPVASEAPVAGEAPVTTEAPVAAEPPVPAQPKVAAAPPPTPEVVVGAVEADTSGALYIGGTATTGQTVRVYLNDQPLGESKPTPAGTWLVQGNRDLPAGKYTVRADQVDAGGTVIARSEVPFEREVQVADLKPNTGAGTGTAGATASATVPMETVVIKRGDNLWRIARTAWGNGFRWTTIYQANNDQIRNPHWIYPGQIFIMPKGDASWAD